jgi:hypothetical protein
VDKGLVLLTSAAVLGGTLLVAGPSRADPASVVARLDYEAPAGCPEATTFQRRVQGRTQRVVFADTGESTRFIVRVKKTGDGFSATLTRRETNGQSLAARRVRGSDCATVVDALALTAALSVDPDALLSSETSGTNRGTTENTTPPDRGNGSPESDPNQSKKPDESDRANQSETEESDETERTEEEPEDDAEPLALGPVHFVAGVSGGYGYFVQPGGMLLARVTLGISTDSPLPLALELSAKFGSSQPLGAVDEAKFDLVAVAPRLCVGRWGEREGVSLRPCLSFLIGQLTGEGRGIAQPGSTQRSIFAPGAALVLAGPIAAGLGWQVEAGASIPLVSRRFYVGEPSNVVGETPLFAPEVVAGATYSF